MHLEPETIELMNAEIDGANTDRQSAALRDLLAIDPVARGFFEQLLQVCESLDQDEETDPPANLRGEIMSSLRATKAGTKTSPSGWSSRLWPEVRQALRYSYAFAAGLILGVIGYSLTSNLGPVVSNGDVTGTMGLYESTSEQVGVWPLGVDTAGITGEARVKHSHQGFFVEFDIGSPGALEVSLSFDPATFDFGGFGNEPGAARTLGVSRGEITWSQERRQRAYVHFIPNRPEPAEVTVTLFVPGKEAYSKVFQLAGVE